MGLRGVHEKEGTIILKIDQVYDNPYLTIELNVNGDGLFLTYFPQKNEEQRYSIPLKGLKRIIPKELQKYKGFSYLEKQLLTEIDNLPSLVTERGRMQMGLEFNFSLVDSTQIELQTFYSPSNNSRQQKQFNF